MNNKDKELHELLGLPPQGHDVQGETCDHYYETWPDYGKNPLLVLREMMKRDDWSKFADTVGMTYWVKLNDVREEVATEIPHYTVDVEFLLNTTGSFRDLTIRWLNDTKRNCQEPPPIITSEEAALLPTK